MILYIKNTGAATWTKSAFRLGGTRPNDHVSGFIRADIIHGYPSGWETPNRVSMQEDSVAPGGTATFDFWFSIPSGLTSKTYLEYFKPVADGITWLDDLGIYFPIHVN
jgi:hypothetical protein